jgi:predicted nucleic acid-binding protein
VFVIDASAMMTWCFEDERADNADALLKRLVRGGMVAPGNFPLEIVQTLRMSQRRKRVSPIEADAFAALVVGLGIEIDGETASRAWGDIKLLSLELEISAYDAAYLELAMRRSATLATYDKGLVKAAQTKRVSVLAIGQVR